MKVLIVGFGSIARKHVQALVEIDPMVEIYALRSNPEAATEPFVHNVFSMDLAKGLNVDFIIIATPTFMHHKNIHELLALGAPLFIEKPLSNNLAVKEVLPLVTGKKLPTYIACNLRFLDSLKFLKDEILVNNVRINEINVYCGSYLPDWRPQQNFRESYSSSPEKGGGAHLDLIHELDYLYWLFGKPARVNKLLRNKSALNIESVDYANYLLEYKDFAASVILNYYRRDAKRTLEILTDQETILVDILSNSVYRNNIKVYQSDQHILATYNLQLRYFMDNVLTDKENTFNSIKEAFEVLTICLA
jgi:predicted dehydrogenase